MKSENDGLLGRREFLATAAGASAYSLFVFADGASARAGVPD